MEHSALYETYQTRGYKLAQQARDMHYFAKVTLLVSLVMTPILFAIDVYLHESVVPNIVVGGLIFMVSLFADRRAKQLEAESRLSYAVCEEIK